MSTPLMKAVRAAKQKGSSMPGAHGCSGKICGIEDDYNDPNSVRITVDHGPTKKSRTTRGMVAYHEKKTTTLHVPKQHAKHFHHGQQVNIGIVPGKSKSQANSAATEDDDADDY